jgi:hypothetical protein
MEKIIIVSSIITMLISAFMLLDMVYNNIMHKKINRDSVIKYTLLFVVGFLFYKLPNPLGFLTLLFLLLFLFLTRMILLINKLSKQTN